MSSMFSSFFSGSDAPKENKDGAADGTQLLGSLFSTVKDIGKKLKDGVEKATDRAFGDFNREQARYVRSKHLHEQHRHVQPPWVGYECEEELKERIIALSVDKRNFLRDPPGGSQNHPAFDLTAMMPVALSILEHDPRLVEMRFQCVPKLVCEEKFWANYFYRVNLIKQAMNLSIIAPGQEGEGSVGDGHSSQHTSASAASAAATTASVGSTPASVTGSVIVHEDESEGNDAGADAALAGPILPDDHADLINSDFEDLDNPLLEDEVRLEELGGGSVGGTAVTSAVPLSASPPLPTASEHSAAEPSATSTPMDKARKSSKSEERAREEAHKQQDKGVKKSASEEGEVGEVESLDGKESSEREDDWEKELQAELSTFDVDPELAAELENVELEGESTANLEDEISQLLEETD